MSIKDSLEKLQYTSDLIEYAKKLLENESFIVRSIKSDNPVIRADTETYLREYLNKHIEYLENNIEPLEILSLNTEDVFLLKKLSESILNKSKPVELNIPVKLDTIVKLPPITVKAEPITATITSPPDPKIGILMNVDILMAAHPHCDPGTYDNIKVKILQYTNNNSIARCALIKQPNVVFDVPIEDIELLN